MWRYRRRPSWPSSASSASPRMATIDSLLSGGDPRSLGKAELVVRLVLQDPSLTGELFECLFVEDETIRMRASDAFEKVCRVSPSLIEPYLDRLLVEGAQVPQEAFMAVLKLRD